MRMFRIIQLLRFWPPLFGAGIRVSHVSQDLMHLTVSMRLWFWNRNAVGTHFGGSLYAMTDPFYMLMLMELLGPNYIVWDKAALIRFKKPGRGKVKAEFRLTPELVKSIQSKADAGEKVEPVFSVQVLDEVGTLIAEVEKTLYIRKKLPKSENRREP
jgi:hypothetical protein